MPDSTYCRNKILVMKQTTELCPLDYFAAFDFEIILSSGVACTASVRVYILKSLLCNTPQEI